MNFLDCEKALFSVFLLKKIIAQEKTEKKTKMRMTNFTTGPASMMSLKKFMLLNQKLAYARVKVNEGARTNGFRSTQLLPQRVKSGSVLGFAPSPFWRGPCPLRLQTVFYPQNLRLVRILK